MKVSVSFTITKEYYASQLAYTALFGSEIKSIQGLKKAFARKMLLQNVFWYGRCGWKGMLSVAENLGEDEHLDKYNILYEEALKWVELNYPNL